MVPGGKAERDPEPTDRAREDKQTRELEMPMDREMKTVPSPPAVRSMTFDLDRTRRVGSIDLRANPVYIALRILVPKGTVLA